MYRLENNIIKTDFKSLDERHIGGAGYFCFKYMKKYGENTAQINVTTGEKQTYNDLLEKCVRTGIVLRKMGIKKGDTITFCSKTNLNSCVPLIASFFLGAIPSYLDGTMHLYDVIQYIKCTNPKMFLVTPDMLETVRKLTKNEQKDTNIVTFDNEFYKPQEEEEEKFSPIFVDDMQETATIFFSSGSTGFPKGICLNHYMLVYSKIFFGIDNLWIENEPKVIFSYDSFHWTVKILCFFACIREGVSLLISEDEADMKNTWHLLEKYKVNVGYFIPWLLITMIELGRPKDMNLNSLTTIFLLGSSLPTKYYKQLQELLPNVDILDCYGCTEAGSLTSFRKNDLHRDFIRNKPKCVGVPIPHYGDSYKVVDIETGQTVGPNQRGELCVKTKFIMNGYFNLDSSQQFDEDGFFKTGDLAYYDEDFCFYIVDRIKDLIIFQGWHITPAALEAELLSHPAVKAAAVVGVPHEIDTEHPLALVVLNDNFDNVIPKDIEEYVEARVPDKYKLRAGVKIIDKSYLRPGTKIQRYKLKQLVLSGKI